MGESRAAVVLERAEHWIGVDLVAAAVQETAAIIATQVVAARGDRASIVKDVRARSASIQDGIPDIERGVVRDAAAANAGPVAADRAVGDRQRRVVKDAAA